ncbi:MAG: hypothetical protein KME21_10975 [Desmonostoc vinosum HA7617-LM4]|jgi:hypothetical protein|nr:hypothetical protein [Desmonostoc vinosum HA7617-LM4]
MIEFTDGRGGIQISMAQPKMVEYAIASLSLGSECSSTIEYAFAQIFERKLLIPYIRENLGEVRQSHQPKVKQKFLLRY